ncbi:MAG: glutathione synthase, partial [Arenibacterium sp.]
MKIAFQMDPINAVDINADSSFRIAEEAQARGHSLFYYGPDKLAFEEGRITARGHDMTVQRVASEPAVLWPLRSVDLSDFDVVWLRQDPPFDMHYITSTHLLDFLKPTTLVVNDPFWLRNYPENLLVLNFPDLTPPTTIARDLDVIRAFRETHGDVILKPLYGNGGAGVVKLTEEGGNLSSLHELFTGFSRGTLIFQKILPGGREGAKSGVQVEGGVVGAHNPVSAV